MFYVFLLVKIVLTLMKLHVKKHELWRDARGVGVGLASLVTMPAIGAKTGGIKETEKMSLM